MGFLKEPSHILIVLLVLVVLFGSRRLPDAARGLGRSMRIFKAEIKQMQEDGDNKTKPSAAEPTEPLEGKVVRPQESRADDSVRETPRNL